MQLESGIESLYIALSDLAINGQGAIDLKLLNSTSITENGRAGRLAWLGHWLYEPKVAGSSPARPTNNSCRLFASN